VRDSVKSSLTQSKALELRTLSNPASGDARVAPPQRKRAWGNWWRSWAEWGWRRLQDGGASQNGEAGPAHFREDSEAASPLISEAEEAIDGIPSGECAALAILLVNMQEIPMSALGGGGGGRYLSPQKHGLR
jgi:hypothetical protein